MSSHQRTQGYVPSSLPPAAPLVPPVPAIPEGRAAGGFAGVGAAQWDRRDQQQQQALGAARAAASAPSVGAAQYSTPFSPPPDPRGAERAAREAAVEATREREREEKEKPGRLRTVVLPQATLSRFLGIASANTAKNLETCGSLLGREVRSRYVVETLLIPKQHATSDTCTMDEEEGVLVFTEERGLITIGWIHTHPSQSCFMSSVDLHTHASFQRMLPESFAVVCAPKSEPSFGIFRLTDPPGLQTVLKCTAKQAFHPHPDVPIYTDADKGHVQMRDAALEIVDLRR
ncbi:hypothetical protein C8R46DRAFT_882293 [Mycena filopes]|nr:hypothetical protein C8R46DRAFT_882293 [Mycena filopes]